MEREASEVIGDSRPLAVLEAKHLLNPEIQEVAKQLLRYRDYVEANMDSMASELESIARQKAELGLVRPEWERSRWTEAPAASGAPST